MVIKQEAVHTVHTVHPFFGNWGCRRRRCPLHATTVTARDVTRDGRDVRVDRSQHVVRVVGGRSRKANTQHLHQADRHQHPNAVDLLHILLVPNFFVAQSRRGDRLL